jgi:hypothetical protein
MYGQYIQSMMEGIDAILFSRTPWSGGNSKNRPAYQYHKTNTKLLAQRNALTCTNVFCANITEYPIEVIGDSYTKCSDCNKPLKPTIAGERPYEVIANVRR